jgi:hypothetical protein
MRWDHPPVGQQLAGVLEQHHAVAEQAPALVRVGGDDAGGFPATCVRGGARGLVGTHWEYLRSARSTSGMNRSVIYPLSPVLIRRTAAIRAERHVDRAE